MLYTRSIHCGLLGRPRDILVDIHIFVSSYDHDCIFIIDKNRFQLIGVITTQHMTTPRGLFAQRGKLYVACYGNPIGRVVGISLSTFRELFFFPVPRPRGVVIVDERLYVTEVINNRIGVYKKRGEFIHSLGETMLYRPRGICRYKKNMLAIADSGKDRVVVMSLYGHINFIVNNIHAPNDVIFHMGTIYVTEWYNGCIRLIKDHRLLSKRITMKYCGNLSMLTASGHNVFVSDNTHGCIHVFSS